MPPANLQVEINGTARQLEFAADGSITIGRHANNALVLSDEKISRFHCVIQRTDRGLFVRDLGSRNGTQLNGQVVSAGEIRPGDTVQVGDQNIKVVALPQSPAGATPKPRRKEDTRQPKSAKPLRDIDEPIIDDEAQPADPPAAAEGDGDIPTPVAQDDPLVESLEDPAAAASGEASPGHDDDATRLVRELSRTIAALPDKSVHEELLVLHSARGKPLHEGVGKKPGDQVWARLFKMMLTLALRIRSTDIHLEPETDSHRVRMRVDGVMLEVFRLGPDLAARVRNMAKVLCDLDIAQRNAVQDGHFSATLPGRRIDFRVSFTPTVYGQKLVMRLLDVAWAPQSLDQLNLPAFMLPSIQNLLAQDAGMVLACGPTGSGKTTSLYAMIRGIDIHTRNVVTIEDPIEYQIQGITQTPVGEGDNHSFSGLLRSVLRQDPDVILVGEIRDAETARIAMQAAITGHLVFSTVHAKDTIGTIFRLLNLGIEPYLIASALSIVIAQRLLRKLCPDCKRPLPATPDQLAALGKQPDDKVELYTAVGCPACLKTGYFGRRAAFEMFVATEEVRDIILSKPTLSDLRAAVRQGPFATLSQSAMTLALEGVTSIEEAQRIAST